MTSDLAAEGTPLGFAPRCARLRRLLVSVSEPNDSAGRACLLALDAVDPDLGVGLPVAVLAPVALAALHLEGHDLRCARLRRDRADHAGTAHERRPHLLGALAAEQQHL